MHEARIRRHGDPSVAIPQSQRDLPRGESHWGWVAEPNYRQWHQRLRSINGSASEHPCIKGCGRQARHWAYIGESTEIMAFSTSTEDYQPMCVPCHKRHDLARIGQ